MASAQTTVNSTVTQCIKRSLVERLGKDWKPGDRVPPIEELAKEIGAGRLSTYRAVRQLADAGLLVSTPRRGTFVSHQLEERRMRAVLDDALETRSDSESLGEPLKGRCIRVLGAGQNRDGLIVEIATGVEIAVRAMGGDVIHGAYDPHRPHIEAVGGSHAAVMINPDRNVDIICDPSLVLVVINTALETPVGMARGYDVVTVDQEQGGFVAGELLRQAGCRDACFIGGIEDRAAMTYSATAQARLTGFERGWGQSLPDSHRLTCKHSGPMAGSRSFNQYRQLQPRPQGIFVYTDEAAMGVIMGGYGQGLEPGRDYQLVGFDGLAIGRQMHGKSLTTVQVPAATMARQAARFLVSRLADPDHAPRRLSLGCDLYRGNTVTPSSSTPVTPA